MQITFDPHNMRDAKLVTAILRVTTAQAGADEGPADMPSPPRRASKKAVDPKKDAVDSLPIPFAPPSPSPARLSGDHMSDEPARGGLFAVAPEPTPAIEKLAQDGIEAAQRTGTAALKLVKEKPVDLIDLSTAYAMKVGRAGLVLALKKAGVERVVDLKDGAENTRAFIAAIQSEIGA